MSNPKIPRIPEIPEFLDNISYKKKDLPRIINDLSKIKKDYLTDNKKNFEKNINIQEADKVIPEIPDCPSEPLSEKWQRRLKLFRPKYEAKLEYLAKRIAKIILERNVTGYSNLRRLVVKAIKHIHPYRKADYFRLVMLYNDISTHIVFNEEVRFLAKDAFELMLADVIEKVKEVAVWIE